MRLADALIAKGRKADADKMLIETWLGSILSNTGHQAMIDAYPDILAPHHNARVDALLVAMADSRGASGCSTSLTTTKLRSHRRGSATSRKLGDIAARVQAVPEVLKDDVGLAYDRYNWLSSQG